MNCARGGRDEEEEEEEEKLLERPNFSRELVEKVRGFEREEDLLEFLVEERPPELKMGREHYLDLREVEEYMQGLCLKLDIHGYEDRAKRLRYLFGVLKAKFVNKENVFKILVQFLMDMAQRPTAVTHLEVSTCEYSCDPDEEDHSADEDSEKQKALLKEILGEEEDHIPENSYPSGDSLSEWSDDDDEDISHKSNNSLPPGITRPVRTSSSFGEFSDICPEPKKPDPEKLRKEAEQFWKEAQRNAEAHLNTSIRHFVTYPLQSQPVISHRLVLQARFGEYWEWKQSSHQEAPLQVAFVEDVVREVLWQFVISRPDTSPIFNPDWTVKSDLIVSSLSRSTFSAFLNKFGAVLGKLEILRKFVSGVNSTCLNHSNSLNSSNTTLHPSPSKVYRNYAAGLEDISIFIMEHISHIEKELNRLPRDEKDPVPGCTTFVQLREQTRQIVQLIELVYKVHSIAIPSSPPTEDNPTSEEDMPWLTSVKLFSCIEAHLVLETRPSHNGVLLFLYSKCLHALIDEILCALKSLKWDERYSLFTRNTGVVLNDPNFWSECVQVRKFPSTSFVSPATSGEGRFTPLSSLRKLLPKVLNILKTCEVFDQLQEDFTQILGDASKISVAALVQEFLDESMAPTSPHDGEEPQSGVDFFKHFEALGMGSSLAANCFRFLEEPSFVQAITRGQRVVRGRSKGLQYTFQDFFQLSEIPVITHSLTLDKVLNKWFDPFCLSAKQKIEKIFEDYKVLDKMTVFQEIILAVREDFARGIILIAAKDLPKSSSSQTSEYQFEDTLARNNKFQKLLNDCYPPEIRGEDQFSIDLKLDPTSDMNCTFDVVPNFPLNLIVTPQSVAGYLFIGRQLHRIRKSLWTVSSLSLKTCGDGKSNPGGGVVDKNRLLIFRFCLINFCSSLRSFFMLKVFSRDFAEYSSVGGGGGSSPSSPAGGRKVLSFGNDLDSMRKVHENYLDLIQTKMLRHPLIENVLIRKMTTMSESLRRYWTGGISQSTMLHLEDTLKKCWQVVNDFESIKYTPDFNQLSWHFDRPPSYLTN